MTGINVATAGCWEITGRYENDELTFVIWVSPSRLPLPCPCCKVAMSLNDWLGPEQWVATDGLSSQNVRGNKSCLLRTVPP
jgi:hypothetical protein